MEPEAPACIRFRGEVKAERRRRLSWEAGPPGPVEQTAQAGLAAEMIGGSCSLPSPSETPPVGLDVIPGRAGSPSVVLPLLGPYWPEYTVMTWQG